MSTYITRCEYEETRSPSPKGYRVTVDFLVKTRDEAEAFAVTYDRRIDVDVVETAGLNTIMADLAAVRADLAAEREKNAIAVKALTESANHQREQFAVTTYMLGRVAAEALDAIDAVDARKGAK